MCPNDQSHVRVPKTVLWDLGGVFLDWDPRHLYRKLFRDDVGAMEDFLANICTPAWHIEQDKGRNIAEACAELRAVHPEYAELINAWRERGEEMIGGVITGSIELLAELKAAGVTCYALSNMERENWESRREIYDFLSWFDGYFISGCEGVVKPDPRYFELALERFDLVPSESLFIDDRAQNCKVATDLGIPAIVFVSPEALRDQLNARGLLGDSGGHPAEDLVEDPRSGGEIEPGKAGPAGPEGRAAVQDDPGVVG
jgi:2-haloacid dehalogenase